MNDDGADTHEVDGFEYGTLGDLSIDYKLANKDNTEVCQSLSEYKHAAHGMIFARNNQLLWNLYNTRAMIMMQMRFDGVLGFPGGLVDAGEDPLIGLNREMEEEIGLDSNSKRFEEKHHLVTHVHAGKKLVLHFYVMEVSPQSFSDLERKTLSAPEFGIESLGTIRVPLYTMGDGVRGFPAFLANQFAGNSKSQLIAGLMSAKIMSKEEINTAIEASRGLS